MTCLLLFGTLLSPWGSGWADRPGQALILASLGLFLAGAVVVGSILNVVILGQRSQLRWLIPAQIVTGILWILANAH